MAADGYGYRLDHLIASSEVSVTECSYRHDWRRDYKLSDHSALVAELSVEQPQHRSELRRRRAALAELADAQASGACAPKGAWRFESSQPHRKAPLMRGFFVVR